MTAAEQGRSELLKRVSQVRILPGHTTKGQFRGLILLNWPFAVIAAVPQGPLRVHITPRLADHRAEPIGDLTITAADSPSAGAGPRRAGRRGPGRASTAGQTLSSGYSGSQALRDFRPAAFFPVVFFAAAFLAGAFFAIFFEAAFLRGFIFQRRGLPCTSKITASTETGAGSTTGCGCGWSTAPGAGLHRDDDPGRRR